MLSNDPMGLVLMFWCGVSVIAMVGRQIVDKDVVCCLMSLRLEGTCFPVKVRFQYRKGRLNFLPINH